jgi:hypothetical protein
MASWVVGRDATEPRSSRQPVLVMIALSAIAYDAANG